ncbi:MAG: transcription antitermination factor NusB [Xanthomonadales bacterium]|nr:transcription antitermination factor NusB [Xanthomonadales bacterium]
MTQPHRFEPQRRARRRALQALYQWRLTSHAPADILVQFREEQDFEGVDEALFEALVTRVADQQEDLAERLQAFVDRPWEQLDLIEQIVLGIGAYELLHCEGTPARVILDEAVDLARRFGAEQGHRFVNGVLDKASRAWRPGEHEPVAGAGVHE